MLYSLPTEMAEAVVDYLSLTDFKQLRLVCSTLHQQSMHQFRERYFQQISLTWSIESFQSLLEVSRHPYFGLAIKHLAIDSTPSYAIRLWKLNRQAIETPDHDLENRLNNEEDSLSYEAERMSKYWSETLHDQKDLIQFFKHVRYLDSVTFAFDGMDRHLGKFARMYCERSRNEMSRPFVTTMAAIAISGVTVKNVYLHKVRNYGAISIGRLESLSPFLSKFQGAFENLDTLQINLRDWRYPEEGFEPLTGTVPKAPFVVRFLSKCVNIRRFEVSCFSSLENDMFSELAKHCKFPRMEYCRLELFRIFSMEDLPNFLIGSKSSLRTLSLSHFVLRDESATWADLLRRLASDLNLETLELKSLFTRRGARLGIADGPIKGTLVLSGPDFIKNLEYYAENLVAGNWGPAWHLASTSYPFLGLRF